MGRISTKYCDDSGNLDAPSSFLNTQFLICNMGRIEIMAIWYPPMSRTDVQAELVGYSVAPPHSE